MIVIVNVTGVPVHVPETGVTVIVPEIAEVPVFVPVNAAIFPVPEAPNPMEVLVFVQL